MEHREKKIVTLGRSSKNNFQVILFVIAEISKEKILKTFLKIPLNTEMNSNIFENNEDSFLFFNTQIKK